jgi:serine/threonine protein kinase/formylglycine-generating enzyme required for sulfatase activity
VYQAHDGELDRLVAIKVPRPDRFASEKDFQRLLEEARTVAALNHPGIAAVYDVGRQEDGTWFVVMEYIEGESLAHHLRLQRPSYDRTAELMVWLAQILQYAHERGLIHCDLKPANILIDGQGNAHVVDFGLAVHEQKQRLRIGEVAGTVAYMAPEQVRGEGHRLDGRTDLWSLGVVLYELLTRHLPFGGTISQVLDEILTREPKPPRQLDGRIPKHLERICLKCLAKRMTDRYPTAADLADDLRHWLSTDRGRPPAGTSETASLPAGGTGSLASIGHGPLSSMASHYSGLAGLAERVVPKGLRAFDAQDAEFFLDLLPGPRNRQGLPDSIAFWKTRLEESDPDKTFSVGLIYGPSGCGKSSLVKAGLLPRLEDHVVVIYVEATPQDTEARLLKQLHKRCPGLPAGLGLVQTMTALREENFAFEKGLPGQKVVLVLDQFEQWLHAQQNEPDPELVRALRQCDGRRVQGLLMVRDDFWMATTRFMRDLEVPILEGDNSAAVDLFNLRHARKVLTVFGQAFGALAERVADFTPAQEQFLERAVVELAEDGKVIPVRLTLFTEMFKARAWTPETLRSVGGVTGIGVTFLEETFSSSNAPPAHRLHQRAARQVLQALLPGQGTELKGHMRSYQELLAASGYASRPNDFEDLLHILDTELRLVTPIDVEGVHADGEQPPLPSLPPPVGEPQVTGADGGVSSPAAGKYYQLTHDYLVPSLRDWLTRKQKESWRGRAELRLEERAAQWSPKRESRFLPSFPEYLRIAVGVPSSHRKPEQKALMRAATRYHATYWGAVLVGALLVGLVVRWYTLALHEAARAQQAHHLVEAVLGVSADEVPHAIEALQPFGDLAAPALRARFETSDIKASQRLRAAVFLAGLGEVEEDFLVDSLRTAPPGEWRNVVSALRERKDSASWRLRDRFQQEQQAEKQDRKMKVRWATALLFLDEPRAAQVMLAAGPDPIDRTYFIEDFKQWRGDLSALPGLLRGTQDEPFRSGLCLAVGTVAPDSLAEDVRSSLEAALAEVFQNARDGGSHSAAGWALRQWKAEHPPLTPADQPNFGHRWFINKHGMTMLEIIPGTFEAGDAKVPTWADIILAVHPSLLEKVPTHKVELTRRFFLCDKEVSVGLYAEFMNDPTCPARDRPEKWKPDANISPSDDCPAHMVNWVDAVQFCNWLSRKEGRKPCYERNPKTLWKTKRVIDSRVIENEDIDIEAWQCNFEASGYRLPTEAEWEYACRAGSTTWWCIGNDDKPLATYALYNQELQMSPCGSKMPNSWGLFDMHGNAREWCWDWYDDYPMKPVTDPCGPADLPLKGWGDKVHRGGSWYDVSGACRSSFRNRIPLLMRDRVIGFRVACGAK